MQARDAFGTVLTAMVTPFTPDGSSIDFDAAAQLANDLVDLGNDGLVINGTTGESATTADEEKVKLIKVVVAAVGDRARVVAGAGNNDTLHSVELAKQAANAGAHGLLIVTPYYNKPPQAGVLAHFHAVADATELPVMVYDIPGRAGIAIETETLIRLSEHPRILAIKDAKADPFAASQVMSRCDLAYYSGDDGLTLPLLALGAVGVVSVTGHLVADRHRKVIEAVADNDLATARAITKTLVPVTEGVMTRMQGAIATKAALEMLGRAGGGALRLPLVPATAEQRTKLREELIAGGINL